jgi:hypothetical protein
MIHRRIGIVIGLILFGFVNTAAVAGQEYPRYVLYDVSCPQLSLKTGEHIKAFDIEVRGDVFSINLPAEWNVNIDKEDGGRIEIQGSIVVGAAALAESYLSYFNDFMIVAHEFGDPKYMGSYFNIRITFTIVTYPTEDTRQITLGLKDLNLKPWQAPPSWKDWVGNIQSH